MSISKPTYEELIVENKKLRKLVSERTDVDNSLINSSTILPNEGEIGSLDLADIIDSDALQTLMEQFYKVVPVASAIGNLSGKALASVGWQDICTKFHRCHPETAKNCHESDTILAGSVPIGTFKPYRCKNNMWDMAAPIEIAGRHFGNIFIGQFFYTDDEPDINQFRQMALQYGFDETEYLAALGRVPRLTRQAADAAMAFYSELTKLISKLSLGSIKLAKTLNERKQVQEELLKAKENAEKSEIYLNSIINNIGAPVFVKDDQSRILLTNEAFCSLFDLSRDQMIGQTLAEEVPPEEQESFLSIDKEVIETGKENINEETFSVIGKQTKIFSTKKSRFIDVNGEKYLIGIIHDITEQKQTEIALQESMLFNETLLNTSPDIIYIYDIVENKNVYSNDGIMRILGYSVEEIQEMGNQIISQLMHPDDFKKYLEETFPRYQELRDKELHIHEFRMKHKNGRWFWLLSKESIFLRDSAGKPVQVFGIVSDITERKLAENRIKDSEENYRMFVDNTPDFIYTFDSDGKHTAVNKSVCEAMGLEADMIIGKDHAELGFPPEFVQEWQLLHKRVFDTKEVVEFESETMMPDGNFYTYQLVLMPIFDESRNVISLRGTSRNITDEKKAQIALKESEAHAKILFDYASIPIWEEDFSEVKIHLDQLKKDGIDNFKLFYEENPDEIYRLASMIKIVQINQKSKDFYGVNSLEELVTNLPDWFIEDSWKIFKAEIIALAEGKVSFESEIPVCTPEGEIKFLYLHLSIPPPNVDDFKRVIVSFIDITDRKLAEQAVKESEERFASAFNESPIPLNITDFETGERLAINDKYVESFGYSRDELLSGNLYQADISAENKELMEAVDQIKREGFLQDYPFRMLAKNGDVRDLLLSAARINNEYKNQFIVSSLDITDSKLAEEDLKQSEYRFRSVFEESTDGIMLLDSESNPIDVNNKICELLGYNKDELLAINATALIHPVDAKTIEYEDAMQVLLSGKPIYSNYRLRRKDGSYIFVELSTKMFEDERFLNIIRDITAQKKAKEELIKHKENLEEIVQERTKNLEEKNKELERFNDLFVDREFRIKELKEQIKEFENSK